VIFQLDSWQFLAYWQLINKWQTYHPSDEVKVVSKRFGKGAADIEQYLKLDGYKLSKKR